MPDKHVWLIDFKLMKCFFIQLIVWSRLFYDENSTEKFEYKKVEI